MLTTTPRILNTLAAAVWIIGGVVLLLKARSLLIEAEHLRPGAIWPWVAVTVGLGVGVLKGRLLFIKACHKNLNRIAALDDPQLWQFYTIRFFIFLTLMISAGTALSRLAHGNYPFLLAVAALDLTIAVALLGSSFVYLRRRAFSANPVEISD